MKTLKNYPGNKGSKQMLAFIINNIPKTHSYLEAFGGSAAVAMELIRLNIPELYEITICEKNETVRHLITDKLKHVMKVNDETLVTTGYDGFNAIKLEPMDGVIYFDPPYKMSSRRSKKPIYGEQEWDDPTHAVFLAKINEKAMLRKFFMMVSHYPCPMYDNALKDWHSKEIQVMTRGGLATEKIWMNYDINGLDLLTTKHLALNAHDRQRLQRQKRLLLGKLTRMPRHQRQFIIDSVNEKFKP